MQHIFNIAVEFEDEHIQQMIYAKAENEVIKKVIQDVENAIYEHSCWNKDDSSERNRRGVTQLIKDYTDQFFTDNKDAIIKETSKILADRLSRTKAAKKLVNGE